MLEGLEISEISILLLHKPIRLEAEYYKKSHILIEKLLKSKNTMRLSDIAQKITDGTHFTPTYTECGIPFLSALNVLENRLSFEAGHQYISPKEHQKLIFRCEPKEGDILLRKVGVGPRWAAVVPPKLPGFSIFVSVALIRLRNETIAPEVLAIFINSKYGQNQLLRMQKGASQPDLHLEDIHETLITVFSKNFQSHLVRLYVTASNKQSASNLRYKKAEELLSCSLGLINFNPPIKSANIKPFKESFGKTGRLDAEHYQKKYETYQNHIFSNKNGWQSLKKICSLVDINYTPHGNFSYNYIELADIDKSGSISSYTTQLGKELPSRARRKVKENDVLISSIEGSLSSCAIVPKTLNNALCSTGFYVINSKKINSETLLVLFKCDLMQNLLKQNCSGTILTAINKNEFLNLPIPIIDLPTQNKIAIYIQKSFELKAESEKLLQAAKHAVEIAIEKDEQSAVKFLAEETKLNFETLKE